LSWAPLAPTLNRFCKAACRAGKTLVHVPMSAGAPEADRRPPSSNVLAARDGALEFSNLRRRDAVSSVHFTLVHRIPSCYHPRPHTLFIASNLPNRPQMLLPAIEKRNQRCGSGMDEVSQKCEQLIRQKESDQRHLCRRNR